jgi:hypothetical protein
MNRKLAIFGFAIVWIVAIGAIIFMMLPKLYNTSSDKVTNSSVQTNKTGDSEIDNLNNKGTEDSFFYDKKVFVRHKKNGQDSTVVPEKVILVRKNIFFKPPPIREKAVEKPVVKTPVPKKVDNSDFDIKPVPTHQ